MQMTQGKKDPKQTALARRIVVARKARGVSQSAVARALKVTRSVPGQWEAGWTEPNDTNMAKLASFLQISLEWLATGRGDGPTGQKTTADRDGGRALAVLRAPQSNGVKELDARAGMGGGGVIDAQARPDGYIDPIKEDQWFFPPPFMREVLRAPASRLLVMESQGDSNYPTIGSGDHVVVDTGHKVPSPDAIYALRDRFGLVVIKRLQVHTTEPKVSVISDNPAHKPEVVGLDEIEIIGRVILHIRRL